MKRRRHSLEQIIRKLAKSEKFLGQGQPTWEVPATSRSLSRHGSGGRISRAA